jgi:hypothetical protein
MPLEVQTAPPHGRGVYCTFFGSWWMVSRHDLIVCKNWYKHNLKVGLRWLCTAMYLKISAMNEFFNPKVGLRALFSGPHWLAPYPGAKGLWECLTACKALSHANAKGTGTNNWVIKSLDD